VGYFQKVPQAAAWSLGGFININLAVEMKNPRKLALLSFNRTAAFLCDVTVSENDVLEAR